MFLRGVPLLLYAGGGTLFVCKTIPKRECLIRRWTFGVGHFGLRGKRCHFFMIFFLFLRCYA